VSAPENFFDLLMEVVRVHRVYQDTLSQDSDNWACACDRVPRWRTREQADAHLVDELLTALDIGEERAANIQIDGRVPCTCEAGEQTPEELHSCGYRPGVVTFPTQRRFVTRWTTIPERPTAG